MPVYHKSACQHFATYLFTPSLTLMGTAFAVNCAALIRLQVDFATIVKWHTLALHFATFPVLICFGKLKIYPSQQPEHYCVYLLACIHTAGWTKGEIHFTHQFFGFHMTQFRENLIILWTLLIVWSTSYSTPPSAFRLNSSQYPNVSHYRRFVGPLAFNLINITMFITPFVYAVPFTAMAATKLKKIEKCWIRYNDSHSRLIDQLTQPQTTPQYTALIRELEVDILNDIKLLLHLGDGIFTNIRWISGGFLIMDLTFMTSLLGVTWWIMRPLKSQIKTLRECAARRKCMIAMNNDDAIVCPVSLTCDSSDYKQPVRNFQSRSSPLKLAALKSCFPSFQRGTEVSPVIWTTNLFQDRREDWEKLDELILNKRYLTLSRYASNTVWHAILVTLVSFSYLGLNFVVGKSLPLQNHGLSLWVSLPYTHSNSRALHHFSCERAGHTVSKQP